MKHIYGIIICCLFCFLICQTDAHAAWNSRPELPFLVQEANTVCIVRVTQVEDLGRTQVDSGYKDSSGNPIKIVAEKAVADVIVDYTLKGEPAPTTLQVTFFKNVHEGSNPTPFTEVVPQEREILFLDSTNDKSVFSLSEPSSNGHSKINIGTVDLKTPAEATPLQNILAVLTNALADKSKAARLDCLQQIGSIGFALNLKLGDPSYSVVINLTKSLNEPGASGLKTFIDSRILPTIVKLIRDTDSEVHKAAVYAAGRLQDADVLPTLAEMANKEAETGMGNAAMIIGEYEDPEAVRPLTRLLESKNDDVRKGAAEALRSLGNPLAVPFLLEHLNDPYPWAKYYIVTALYTAIDPSQCPGPLLFQAREDEYVSFWKKWANEHQDKVAALREQFIAPLPAKAVH